MRKVMGVFVVALLALCTTAWSAESKQPDRGVASSQCSSPATDEVAIPALESFSLEALPAACTDTCSSLQWQPCSVNGKHYFCMWASCRTWGCTCMDGFIECGLP